MKFSFLFILDVFCFLLPVFIPAFPIILCTFTRYKTLNTRNGALLSALVCLELTFVGFRAKKLEERSALSNLANYTNVREEVAVNRRAYR